jgi:hypothetical protein
MRRLGLAGVFLAVVGLVLYGQAAAQQPFVVQYVDGSVQIQLKGQTTWKRLPIKAEVPVDASIRVGRGGMIELSRQKTVLSLIKEGVYSMTQLVGKLPTSDSSLGASVAEKLAAVSKKQIQTSTAAIVRADKSEVLVRGAITADWSNGGYTPEQFRIDEKTKAAGLAQKELPPGGFEIDNLQFFYWGIRGGYAEHEYPRMYEEYKDGIDRGIRALLGSRYEEAIESLRSAVNAAIFPDEERRANYLLAVAYVEAGSPVRAWKIISSMTVQKDDLEYGDFLLRKAQLEVDAAQYEDALVTLKPLVAPLVQNEFGQTACLVAYYAYRGLNRGREAADIRQKGLAITFSTVDEKGNPVVIEPETARMLKSLD